MNLIDSLLNDENIHPAFRRGLSHNPNVEAEVRKGGLRFLERPADVSAFGWFDPAPAIDEQDAASNLHSTGAA